MKYLIYAFVYVSFIYNAMIEAFSPILKNGLRLLASKKTGGMIKSISGLLGASKAQESKNEQADGDFLKVYFNPKNLILYGTYLNFSIN